MGNNDLSKDGAMETWLPDSPLLLKSMPQLFLIFTVSGTLRIKLSLLDQVMPPICLCSYPHGLSSCHAVWL